MTTKVTRVEEPDRIQVFLYDLNVELDYDYADPSRELFADLAPHYAQHAHLPLSERVAAAYFDLKDGALRQRFYWTVSGAIARSAGINLGHYRTLVLLEIALEICPEAISNDHWRHLLFRLPKPKLADWLADLALRLERWDINVTLRRRDWTRMVDTVHPRGFENVLRWGFKQQAEDAPSQIEFSRWLLQQVRTRLSRNEPDFSHAGLDVGEVMSRLRDDAERIADVIEVATEEDAVLAVDDQLMRDALTRSTASERVEPDLVIARVEANELALMEA